MNRALSAAVVLFSIVRGFCADPPYGMERREFVEPFMNRRLPQTAAGTFPELLSQTGVMEATGNMTPSRAMIPYTVNSPLWSDAALKTRWLCVPKDSNITFADTYWNFPKGSVFVKHFDL